MKKYIIAIILLCMSLHFTMVCNASAALAITSAGAAAIQQQRLYNKDAIHIVYEEKDNKQNIIGYFKSEDDAKNWVKKYNGNYKVSQLILQECKEDKTHNLSVESFVVILLTIMSFLMVTFGFMILGIDGLIIGLGLIVITLILELSLWY